MDGITQNPVPVTDCTQLIEMRATAQKLADDLGKLIEAFAAGANHTLGLRFDYAFGRVKKDCEDLVKHGFPVFETIVGREP